MARKRKGDTSPNALEWCRKHDVYKGMRDWILEEGIQTMNEFWEKCQDESWAQFIVDTHLYPNGFIEHRDYHGSRWPEWDAWFRSQKYTPSMKQGCNKIRELYKPVGYDDYLVASKKK